MADGIAGGLKVREKRRTYYKLHPNQAKYPGAIIEMPNLPEDQYHWEVWQQKGYKTNPEDLMPGKPIVYAKEWGCKKFDIPSEEILSQKRVCSICQQECVGDFGLQSHMKKHKERSEGGQ